MQGQTEKHPNSTSVEEFNRAFEQNNELNILVEALCNAIEEPQLTNEESISGFLRLSNLIEDRLAQLCISIYGIKPNDITEQHLQVARLAAKKYFFTKLHFDPRDVSKDPFTALAQAFKIISETEESISEQVIAETVIPSIHHATVSQTLNNAIKQRSLQIHNTINNFIHSWLAETDQENSEDQQVKELDLGPATQAASKYLTSMSEFKIKLNDMLQNIVLKSEPPIKSEKARTFEQLTELATAKDGLQAMPQRSLEHQASFLHQVSRVKYKLTGEEIRLLQEATGLRFGKIGYKNGQTYLSAKIQIEGEITNRTLRNNEKFLGFIPWRRIWPLPTAHLKAAQEYLDFYEQKNKMTKTPEHRLGADTLESGKHRNHPDFQEVKTFRKLFTQSIKNLSNFSSRNRAMKKLHSIFLQKHSTANKLKATATLLKANKYERNHNAHEALTTRIQNSKDGVKIVPGKFFAPSKLLKSLGHFSTSFKEAHRKDLNVEDLRDLTMDCTLPDAQAITYNNTHFATLQLITQSQFMDFNPESDRALNEVGVMLKNVKQTLKDLKEYGTHHSRCLTADLQAQTATKDILTTISDAATSENIEDLLLTAINDFDHANQAYIVESQDAATCSTNFLSSLKNKQIEESLSKVLEMVRSNQQADILKLLHTEIISIQQSVEELSIKKTTFDGHLKTHINNATDTVRALTYMADHTTTSLNGLRA